jgi:hypothetical protein
MKRISKNGHNVSAVEEGACFVDQKRSLLYQSMPFPRYGIVLLVS